MDNLAEGFDRGSRGEFMQSLGYAKGSAREVKSQLYRAFDNDYLTKAAFDLLTTQIARASSLIKGLLTYLNGSAIRGGCHQSAEEPTVSYKPPEFV